MPEVALEGQRKIKAASVLLIGTGGLGSPIALYLAAAGVGRIGLVDYDVVDYSNLQRQVIHGMSGEQDMRQMGGLKRKMPVTYRTFLIGTISIAGFIPFAGFFSKDEILWKAWAGGHPWLWVVGSIAALLTACYMFRLLFLTFFGDCRATAEVKGHIHESPRTMTVPLMILAVLSVVGGWIGIPKVMAFGADINVLHHWLEPSFAGTHGAPAMEGMASEALAEEEAGGYSSTARMRRMPADDDCSLTIRNRPSSSMFPTCGPPQISLEKPPTE